MQISWDGLVTSIEFDSRTVSFEIFLTAPQCIFTNPSQKAEVFCANAEIIGNHFLLLMGCLFHLVTQDKVFIPLLPALVKLLTTPSAS